jgi:hypothetical protein
MTMTMTKRKRKRRVPLALMPENKKYGYASKGEQEKTEKERLKYS